MLRHSFAFFATLISLTGLNAQTNSTSTDRLTAQQLNPAAAERLKETTEVESFTRKLASLKSAYAEKNTSQIVANEACILRGMRNEADQLELKGNSNRLEKTNSILAAFEGHAFDLAQPEAAAQDFAKLDAFLKMMQDALLELKD
jgi:hypothetical protein